MHAFNRPVNLVLHNADPACKVLIAANDYFAFLWLQEISDVYSRRIARKSTAIDSLVLWVIDHPHRSGIGHPAPLDADPSA
jgi:hypothetical protein